MAGSAWLDASELQREVYAAQYVGTLLSGTKWSSTTITWSAPSSAYGGIYYTPVGEAPVFTPFSLADIAQTQDFLRYLSSIVNLQFNYVQSGPSNIRVGYENMTEGIGGYAYYPPSGIVYLRDDYAGTLSDGGSYGSFALIHELGHALGLKHPGDYDAGGSNPHGPVLQNSLDTSQATVMSYNAFSLWNPILKSEMYAQSYMPLDVRALLSFYGVASGIAATSFTFEFSETDSFSYGPQGSTVNVFAPFYLYDANHAVTLDFSNLNNESQHLTVNLLEYGIRYESAEGLLHNQYDYLTSQHSGWQTSPSTFNTTISTNTNVANIVASPLDDLIIMGIRNVTISAGQGFDTIVYGSNYANYLIATSADDLVTVIDNNRQFGSLTLRDAELLQFADRLVDPKHLANSVIDATNLATVIGDAGDNSIYLGANTVFASAGSGNDVFYVRDALQEITVNGDSGFDVAIIFGNRSSYSLVTVTQDRYDVTGPDGHHVLLGIEQLQFADQSLNFSLYGPEFFTAYANVLRSAATASTVESVAPTVVSLSNYVGRLLIEAEESTVPVLVVTEYIEGATPSSARLDALTAFASTQHEYYTRMGVSNPDLGPWEALGMGFAETNQFVQKFGALNDTTFIANNYNDAFGRAATTAQVTHFQHQIDYFSNLYIGVGIGSDVAHVRARGAALGQMLGFAAEESGNDYADAAKGFLLDAADGQVVYGGSLMTWLV